MLQKAYKFHCEIMTTKAVVQYICAHMHSTQIHMCEKFEVSITDILGFIGIYVANRTDLNWLLNIESLRILPKLFYVHMHRCTH